MLRKVAIKMKRELHKDACTRGTISVAVDGCWVYMGDCFIMVDEQVVLMPV